MSIEDKEKNIADEIIISGTKGGNFEDEHLPAETIESLKDHVIELEKQVQENWDRALRAASELDNVRKRAARDIENAHKFGIEDFVQSLLPVVDAIENAIQLVEPKNNDNVYSGLDLTLKMFKDVLMKYNITQIDPINQVFDPSKHEAMMVKETDETSPNTVLSVYQKGYLIFDRVIRPARVVVSKATIK